MLILWHHVAVSVKVLLFSSLLLLLPLHDASVSTCTSGGPSNDSGSTNTGLWHCGIERTSVETSQMDSNEFTPLYFIPLLSFPVFLRTSQKSWIHFRLSLFQFSCNPNFSWMTRTDIVIIDPQNSFLTVQHQIVALYRPATMGLSLDGQLFFSSVKAACSCVSIWVQLFQLSLLLLRDPRTSRPATFVIYLYINKPEKPLHEGVKTF